jgi:hypothetical protein
MGLETELEVLKECSTAYDTLHHERPFQSKGITVMNDVPESSVFSPLLFLFLAKK